MGVATPISANPFSPRANPFLTGDSTVNQPQVTAPVNAVAPPVDVAPVANQRLYKFQWKGKTVFHFCFLSIN